MSKEYLKDQEKRILLSALSHEMKLVKDNNLTELIPVVKSLDIKFMYDRLFKKIECEAYEQGRTEERKRIIKELENRIAEEDIGSVVSISLRIALDIVRGGENE